MFLRRIVGIAHKKKLLILKRLKMYIILTGMLLIGMVVFFENQIIPFENKCIEKEAEGVATKIINRSVAEILEKKNYTYSDLAVINYSEKGVNSVETNSTSISRMKAEVSEKIQRKLDNDKIYSFKVPVGAFTKINELSGMGPDIDISFRLTGAVNCKIKSEFESAGVNQTVHHIYLVVIADIITISPEYSPPYRISTDYEIAQTIIVGSTPGVYADVNK